MLSVVLVTVFMTAPMTARSSTAACPAARFVETSAAMPTPAITLLALGWTVAVAMNKTSRSPSISAGLGQPAAVQTGQVIELARAGRS